jgi:hypothetical protein
MTPSRSSALALAGLVALLGCASVGARNAATKLLPVLHASDAQDGGTVTLRQGQKLRIVLHSTYWQFKAVTRPKVLRLAGEPQVIPKMEGCVPGQGCGTVTATFVARRRGSVAVTATRTTCGEALACTATSGRYRLTVTVRAASRS